MTAGMTNHRKRWNGAATLAFMAGLLLLPQVGASLLEQVTVYGFEIRQSNGAKLSQHLIADMSHVASDDVRSIIAENPVCRVIMEGEETPVQVTSTLGRYYFRGPGRTPEEGVAAPPLPVEVVTQWNTELKATVGMPLYSNPSRGDILFSDTTEEGRVHVDLGERGELHARHLLWSEEYQRFIALGGFVQRTVNERGDRIRTSGQVFTADDQFQNISYPGVAGQDIVIEID